MLGTRTGELLGQRPALLSLALIRVFIASAVLLRSRPPEPSGFVIYATQGMVLGWAAIALAGLFLNLPRAKSALLRILLLDCVFVGGVILLGAPVTAVLILLFDDIALRSSGWRWTPAMAALPLSLIGGALWWTDTQPGMRWGDLRILPSDIAIWGFILLCYAVMLQLTTQRRAGLEGLGGDVWIDAILVANQPFSYDFTRWINQVGLLFGGERTTCLLALIQKSGRIRVFSNDHQGRFHLELTKSLNLLKDHSPCPLSVVRDRDRQQPDAGDDPMQQLPLLPLLDHAVVMAKHFKLGMRTGILIIAHNQPNDAILNHEAHAIDQALDGIIARIDSTMEVRRAFLSEAREIARRDLHDGVLQSLAALRMRLLTIIQSSDVTPPIRTEIRNTAEIVALEQARLRSLLDENGDLDQPLNLVEALRLCVKTTALQWEVEMEFVSHDVAIPMHRESSNNIEYLAREIIANAARHSGSKHLRCSLALRDDNLIISVMDLSATPISFESDFQDGPLASYSLQQRLTLVNGWAYSDGLQSGTLLAIAIPLVYDEADL